MKLTYLICTTCLLYLGMANNSNAQIQKGTGIEGESGGDGSGSSISMPDANTIAIGAVSNDGNGISSGHVRIYNWNGTSWIQKGQDIDGESANDNSGWAVSMPDGNTIAIGAKDNDGNGVDAGHARVFEWNGSTWVQKGSDIDGEAAGDWSGAFISMPDANYIAIGAQRNDGNGTDAGHARIYKWNGNTWVQKGADIDGEAPLDMSGHVSMPDSNTVAIGATSNDGNGSSSGHSRVFEWDGNNWVQKGADIDGEAGNDASGIVSMPDNNTIAIGAPFNDGNGMEAGHVRVYEWSGIAWVQKGADIDGDFSGIRSGSAVSMPDANTLAIGAPKKIVSGMTDAGHVRIFNWNGTLWTQQGNDINGQGFFNYCGESVSMPDTNTVATGATGFDGTGAFDVGHVRIFEMSTTTHLQDSISNESLKVFPNPAQNTLTIQLPPNNKSGQILIYDEVGHLQKSYSNLFGSFYQVETTYLTEGVYFLVFQDTDREFVRKIIINR